MDRDTDTNRTKNCCLQFFGKHTWKGTFIIIVITTTTTIIAMMIIVMKAKFKTFVSCRNYKCFPQLIKGTYCSTLHFSGSKQKHKFWLRASGISGNETQVEHIVLCNKYVGHLKYILFLQVCGTWLLGWTRKRWRTNHHSWESYVHRHSIQGTFA